MIATSAHGVERVSSIPVFREFDSWASSHSINKLSESVESYWFLLAEISTTSAHGVQRVQSIAGFLQTDSRLYLTHLKLVRACCKFVVYTCLDEYNLCARCGADAINC